MPTQIVGARADSALTRSGRALARGGDASQTAVIILRDSSNNSVLYSSPSPYTTWTLGGSTAANGTTPVNDHSDALSLDASRNASVGIWAGGAGNDDYRAASAAGYGTLTNTITDFIGSTNEGGPIAVVMNQISGRVWYLGNNYTTVATPADYQGVGLEDYYIAGATGYNGSLFANTGSHATPVSFTGWTPAGNSAIGCWLTYDAGSPSSVYVFYTDSSQNLNVWSFTDNAASNPAQPSAATTLLTNVYRDAVSVTRDSAGGLHVAATTSTGIQYLYKPQGGAWSSATLISSTTQAADTYPALCTFGSTNVLLAWQHNTGTNQNNLVYVTAAISGSPAFSAQTAFFTDAGSVNASYLSCEPQSADGATVLFAWMQGTANPWTVQSQLVTPSFGGGAAPPATVSVAAHGQWPNPLRVTQRMALTTKSHFLSGISENDAVAGSTEQFYGEPDPPVISNARGAWPNPLRITQRMALTWLAHAPVPGTAGAGIAENDLTASNVGQFYGVVNAPATRNILDTAAGSEGLSISATAPVSDSATGSEAVSISATVPIADSATGSDAVSVFVSISISDSATGSEALSFATVAVAVSDSATGTDAYTSTGILLADSASGSESLSFATVAVAVADSATGTDVYTATGIPQTDSASGSESLSFATVAVGISDSATGTDVYTSTGILLTDSATGSQALSFATVAVPVSDSATGSESLSFATIAVSTTDSATGSDAVSVNTGGGSTPISVSDSAAGSESVSISATVPLSDSATGSEALSFAVVSVSVSDSATGTESLSLPTIAVPVADAAAGSEALGFATVAVPVADAAVGSEAAPSIFATLSVSDSALGSEVLLRIVQVFLNDSATGTETFALGVVAVAVVDSAVGSEQINLPTTNLGNAFVVLVVPNGVVILRAQNGRVNLVAPAGQAKLLP